MESYEADFVIRLDTDGGIAEYFDGYWHNDFKMPKKAMKEIIAIIKKYEEAKDADSN